MILYPSLDLLEGSIVRLEKGDFNKVTTFGDDPFSWVSRFETAGAKNLHLVDLSGAKDSAKRQTTIIKKLIRSTKLKVQVGGGLREMSDVEDLLVNGADKIIIGSLAILRPEVVEEMISEFGEESFCIALDVQVRGDCGYVMTHGWTEGGSIRMENFLRRFSDLGVKRFLCTDIAKDGMMKGPNFLMYQKIRENFPELEIQASGGVSCIEDLRELNKLGLHSVILGRSILSEKLSLAEIFS